MPSTAIIEFIGLVTFALSAGPPSARITAAQSITNNAFAVMPSVSGTEERQTSQLLRKPIVSHAHTGTPEHRAMLAFPTKYLRAAVGWKPDRIGDFSYVDLHGDQITFSVDASNDPVKKVPEQLTHLGGSLRMLQYPYPGAAAVFQIPEGTLRACLSLTTGTSRRIDTELSLNNSGKLVITSGSKSLTLDGDATVLALNEPGYWIQQHLAGAPIPDAVLRSSGESSQHFEIYCRMVGRENDAKCQAPTTLPTCEPCQINYARSHDPQSNNTNADARFVHPTTPPPSGPFFIASFECSNSQWP